MNFYEKYINSPEWKHKRLARLKLDKFRCRTCGSEEDLECHHVSYEYLGNEPLSDLITLCKICHEAITSSIRERRYNGKKINFDLNTERKNVKYEETIKPEVKFEKHERTKLNYVEAGYSEIEFSITSDNAQRSISRPSKFSS